MSACADITDAAGCAPGSKATAAASHWLDPLEELARNRHEALGVHKSRLDRLCELNFDMQVENLAHMPILQRAWAAGQDLSLHGWIYGLDDGLIHDLNCTCGTTPSG